MHSMTGYGRMSVERDGRQLTVELKSVNHRFLDLSFRMPRSFNFLEDSARRLIGEYLSRGHVDLFATYRNTREDSRRVEVDQALLAAYMTALDDIAETTGLEDDRTLSLATRLPDVLTVAEADEDQDALRALMREALTGALEQMQAMREKEGEALKSDISSRIDTITPLSKSVPICGRCW